MITCETSISNSLFRFSLIIIITRDDDKYISRIIVIPLQSQSQSQSQHCNYCLLHTDGFFTYPPDTTPPPTPQFEGALIAK